MLHHSPPQPEPSLVQLLVVRRDVAKPDIASEEDLQVPVLVEGDQVADISVTHVGLLRQHSRHKHVVNSEDSFVAVLERLLLKEKLILSPEKDEKIKRFLKSCRKRKDTDKKTLFQ